MKKKKALFFINLTGLILAVILLPDLSIGITPQGMQGISQTDTSQRNLRVERIIVKEVGYGYITSSDGRIIRFNNETRVYRNVNRGRKMRRAELHYVSGRLATVYIMQ